MSAAAPSSAEAINTDPIEYVVYTGEHQLQGIIDLISVDLSEPYSVFTYRYFINNWPNLCYLAVVPAKAAADESGPAREERVVGCIVCKQDAHRTTNAMRGYIAMLAVHHSMRKLGIGRKLVQLAVRAMRDGGCDEAVLETEMVNLGALRLYEGLGFVRDKRLHRYYLNGNDAFRLKVWFHSLDELSAGAAADTREESGVAAEKDEEEKTEEIPPRSDGHAVDDQQPT